MVRGGGRHHRRGLHGPGSRPATGGQARAHRGPRTPEPGVHRRLGGLSGGGAPPVLIRSRARYSQPQQSPGQRCPCPVRSSPKGFRPSCHNCSAPNPRLRGPVRHRTGMGSRRQKPIPTAHRRERSAAAPKPPCGQRYRKRGAACRASRSGRGV